MYLHTFIFPLSKCVYVDLKSDPYLRVSSSRESTLFGGTPPISLSDQFRQDGTRTGQGKVNYVGFYY